MKKVLIDLERTKYFYSGLGQLCFQWAKNMPSDSEIDFSYLFPPSTSSLKKIKPLQNFRLEAEKNSKVVIANSYKKILSTGFSKFDLWHSTHQDSEYLPRDSSVPVLLSIHDLNFLRDKSEKKILKRIKRLQKKIDRCEEITTISNFTKNEIEQNFELDGKKITVIYCGADSEKDHREDKPSFINENIQQKGFLLSLGVVRPKKNFHVLVEFLSRLKGGQCLVIAGNKSGDYAQRILEEAVRFGVSDRVILPGEISGIEKNWLFSNCQAFLFPSLQEGFGLPPIEAMSFGKPVFLSKEMALPEVGGETAFYWKNFNADTMVEVFEKGMQKYADPENKMIEKLKNHSSQFTWKKASEEHLKVYNRILAASNDC